MLSLTVLIGLLIAQATLGIAQYNLAVPAELVWLHVMLATIVWLTMLWSVGRAGRLAAR